MLVPTKKDFAAYREAVLRYWLALAGFAVFTLIASIKDIAEAVFGSFVMPSWVYYTIGFACIFIAQFLAWLDIKRDKDKLKKHNITQDALAKVASYRNELIRHQNKELKNEIELGKWISEYENKRNEIIDYLRKNITQAESDLFHSLGIFSTIVIQGKNYVNGEHINYCSRVIRDHRWLTTLVIDYSRNKERPDTEEFLMDEQAPTSTS